MDVKSLISRAKEIRRLYTQRELELYGQTWSNQQIFQGLVGDIGELAKLVTAKAGLRTVENVNEKLAHELADCLWSVLILADEYGIDIEQSFTRTMAEIEERIKKP